MIQYIKMAVIALVCGVMAPLPVSSSAHTSFLNSVVKFTGDEQVLSFYYAVFMLAFSFVVFINLRKIYIKTFKSVFKSKNTQDSSAKAYKKVFKNILLSLIPLVVLYIPVSSDGTLLVDYFDKFLASSGNLLSAFACVISAFVIVISIWYTKQKNEATKRTASTKTTVRMAIYQLIAYAVPGMSKVSLGAVNMLICDIEPKVIMREVYLYIAPQAFVVSLVKVIRSLVSDVIVDPLAAIIAFAVCAVASAVIIHFVSRVNMRKLLGFFAVYSAVFGVAVGIISFLV